MAISFYTITLFVHVLTVITWLFTLPINTMITRAVESASVMGDRFKIIEYASVNGKISLAAAIIVFLSGSLLIESGSWSWAPSSGSFWLVSKQTIWLLLLVASLGFLKPANDKMNGAISEENEEEALAQFKNLKIRTHIVTAFILVNIFLAYTKPF